MKRFFGFLGLLCLFFRVGAQENMGDKGVRVGALVPDVLVTGASGVLVDGKDLGGSFRFSALRGRLVILDFWATWCQPCVAMMPRMDSLQVQFGDRLLVLPVAYQPGAVVNAVLKHLAVQGRGSALSQVTGDTVLVGLFPHRTLPHYVWVGGDGVVRAITGQEALTAANINKLLEEGSVSLRVKEDERQVYDVAKPLFFEGVVPDSALRKVAAYIPGLGRGIYKDVDFEEGNSYRRITARNQTLLELFRLAYAKEDKEVLLEVRDPAALVPPKGGSGEARDWIRQGHAFCYELLLPSVKRRDAYTLMRDDLASGFPVYRARLEKRVVKCLALVRTGAVAVEALRSKGGEPAISVDGFGLRMRSCYLYVFLSRMQVALQGEPLPLADLTGFREMADLDLAANMGSVAEVNRALSPYGLAFRVRPAELEMLVLADH